MVRRAAVLRVSLELLEKLLPDWRTVAALRYGELVEPCLSKDVGKIAAPFHAALKLPRDCYITGISTNAFFDRDEVAFRIESPDFVETSLGCVLPEVQAVYQRCLDMQIHNPGITATGFEPGSACVLGERGYFLRWDGSAVAVRREYRPDGLGSVLKVSTHGLPGWVIDAFGPSGQCCKLDSGIRCSRQACYRCSWVEQGGFDETYVCAKHLESIRAVHELTSVASINEMTEKFNVCWKCSTPTDRCLADGTGECEKCAERPLL